MRLQYYIDEEDESVIGLWIPKRKCYIDMSAKEDELWSAMQPEGKKLRKEIETWIAKGAPDGVEIDTEGLVRTSALHVQPGTIACLGLSYAKHAAEFQENERTEPSLFLKSTSAISSDLSYVICPEGAEKLDYEIELAVIIGSSLHRANEEEAKRAIIGYTIMCDYSERSYQLERGGQWTKGKSYDSFAPFGPQFVTKDEIPHPDKIQLQLKVNGEIRQNENTSNLIWPVAKLVAYVSQFMSLQAGDIVSTGTPSGVAMGSKELTYLKEGDIIEFGCKEIGWVKQIVINEDKLF